MNNDTFSSPGYTGFIRALFFFFRFQFCFSCFCLPFSLLFILDHFFSYPNKSKRHSFRGGTIPKWSIHLRCAGQPCTFVFCLSSFHFLLLHSFALMSRVCLGICMVCLIMEVPISSSSSFSLPLFLLNGLSSTLLMIFLHVSINITTPPSSINVPTQNTSQNCAQGKPPFLHHQLNPKVLYAYLFLSLRYGRVLTPGPA